MREAVKPSNRGATARHAPELVLASGVTVHARDAMRSAFGRHGLRLEDHVIEASPPGSAGPDFRVALTRLSQLAKTPKVQVAELIELLADG